MILSELRSYLAMHGRVALSDMVNRFDTDADAVRGMLDLLIRKGRVRRLAAAPGGCGGGCGSCGSNSAGACSTTDGEVFEWIGKTASPVVRVDVAAIQRERP